MRISDWSSDVCSSDLHQRREERVASLGCEGIDLLGRALLLRLGAHRHEAVGAQRVQGRIDRSEACLVEVAERAFLEGLLDLVAAGGAARQHAEAKGLCIHVARSAGSGGFRTPFYIYRPVIYQTNLY